MFKTTNNRGLSTDQVQALTALRVNRLQERLARKELMDQARKLRERIKQIEKSPDCKFVMKALRVGSNLLSYYDRHVGPKVNFEEWNNSSKLEMAAQCVITPRGFKIACDREFKFRHPNRYTTNKYWMWTGIMVHLARGGVTAESIDSAIKELAKDYAKGENK